MNRLLTILNSLSFEEVCVAGPDPPLEVFDADLIKGVLNKCRTPAAGTCEGPALIDIGSKLHPILRQEMEAVNGNGGANQRQIVREEVDR